MRDLAWVQSRFKVDAWDAIGNRYAAIEAMADRPIADLIMALGILGDDAITQTLWAKLAEGTGRAVLYPYMDEEVVRCASAISWDIRLLKPKHILCEVARRLGISDEITQRPKSSFGISPDRWAGEGGALEPLEVVAGKAVAIKDIRGTRSSDGPMAMTHWHILNYGIWKRLFILGHSLNELHGELDEAIVGLKAVAAS